MDSRKFACMAAATFIGVGLALSAANAAPQSRSPVVVTGERIDPELQRRVSYADLNLAAQADQKTLRGRIYRTAGALCWDLNGNENLMGCRRDAVHSTDDQFAAAVLRAQQKMAGLPVGPAIAISMVVGVR